MMVQSILGGGQRAKMNFAGEEKIGNAWFSVVRLFKSL